MKPPAFQFYADDFLAGVADMTQAEVGAYILLLCHQWSRGEIPADPARAALIAKGDVPAHVIEKFPGGKNERLERERQKQADYRAAQADRGKSGADKRWNGKCHSKRHSKRHGASNGVAIKAPMANAWPDDSSPSPSPSPSPVSDTDTNTCAPAKPPRARSPLMDALASVDGSDPQQVTPAAWPAIGRALSAIKAVTPDVTLDEILRRARNYRQKHPDWALTATALAKHWASCERATNQPQAVAQQPIPEPQDWKSWLNHNCPESRFSAGQPDEAHQWSDLDRGTQIWLVQQMRRSA
jgi:uncharacterized protein YdaU (DUF1376 family)